MKTGQHTPGTWHAHEGQIYPEETGHTLALIPYYSGTEEQEANARLIAAAPELLAALQNLLSSYRADFSNITGAALNPTEAVIMAERAIQKAKF